MSTVQTHPVQVKHNLSRTQPRINSAVTLQAYDVYCHVFSAQPALVTNGCRGGFGVGELVAFLYAYPFPKSEWKMRVDEAFIDMEGL